MPLPKPVPDAEHIELYYKTRDDLKEEIAAADSRAVTILIIETALAAAVIAAAPIISWLFVPPPGGHPITSDWAPLTPFSWLAVMVDSTIVLHIIERTFALLWLIVAAFWLCVGTVMTYSAMIEVLNNDFQFQVPPFSKWKFFWLVIRMRVQRFMPDPAPENDRSNTGLPFSPYALLSAHDLSHDMATLDISAVLIADIKAKAAITKDKRLALQQGMHAFAIQIFALLALAFGLVLAHATALL